MGARLLVAIVVSLLLAAVVATSVPAASGGSAAAVVARESAHNEAVAERDAKANLGRLRLPAGARPSARVPSGVPAGRLRGPNGTPGGGRFVTSHSFWTAPGEPSAVLRFLRRHPPHGTELGGEIGGTAGTGFEFEWRGSPRGVWGSWVTITVVGRAGGGSAIRADAWDWWELPRSPASQIPAGAGYLSLKITPSREFGVETQPGEPSPLPPLPPPRFAATANPTFIAGLVRLINRQPAYQTTTLPSCGPGSFETTHEFELTLRDHRGGKVLATLNQHDPIGPCDPLFLKVGGTAQSLSLGYEVLRRVHGLIHAAKPRR
jgi:hypothetical protein